MLSVSAFHGRGFFQPVQSLGDPVAILAAAEAIIGLLIEISFHRDLHATFLCAMSKGEFGSAKHSGSSYPSTRDADGELCKRVPVKAATHSGAPVGRGLDKGERHSTLSGVLIEGR